MASSSTRSLMHDTALTDKLRILVGADVPPDPHSGAAGTVYHTSQALRERGHEVDELWRDDLPHRIRHGNLHYLLELPRGYRDAVEQRCRRKQYDVIQLSQPHAWLAAQQHRRQGRRGVLVIRSHGLEQRVEEDVLRYGNPHPGRIWIKQKLSVVMSRALRQHQIKAARYADGMIVPCRDDRQYLVERLGADPERVATIRHGVPDRFLSTPLKPYNDTRWKKLLYVGQLTYFKGPHVLAEALRTILTAQPDASLTWVCSATDHQQVRALLDPATASRVHLLDWRKHDELMEVYDAHGLFLFPSLTEGAGKACIEAMARGLVAVTSDTSGMRDAIEHERSGMLCQPGSAEAIASAAIRMLSDLPACQAMSRCAREATEGVSWRRCAEEATAFYRRLLASRRSSQRPGTPDGGAVVSATETAAV